MEEQKEESGEKKNGGDEREVKCGPLKKEQVDYFTKHLILFWSIVFYHSYMNIAWTRLE